MAGEIVDMGPLQLRFVRSRHDTGGVLDMFEMALSPGGRMPLPHHHRDWEETVYGLSGTTIWTVDGATVPVGPGDSVFIPRGVVHGFDHDSGNPARCLVVVTPGALGPEYFRDMAALIRPGEPPDRTAMAAVMERYGLIPAAPA